MMPRATQERFPIELPCFPLSSFSAFPPGPWFLQSPAVFSAHDIPKLPSAALAKPGTPSQYVKDPPKSKLQNYLLSS